MNLKERLQLRALTNLIISIIERILELIIRLSPKDIKNPDDKPKPVHPRPRPLKRIIDIIPIPWKKNNE